MNNNMVMTLREWREAYGATQAQLADEAGVAQSTISRLELGKQREIGDSTLSSLADALGIHVNQILIDNTSVTAQKKPIGPNGSASAPARKQSQNICPQCYIALPLTGQCDTCD